MTKKPVISCHVLKFFSILILGLLVSGPALSDLLKLDTESAFDSVFLLQTPESSVIRVGLTFKAGEVDAEGPEGLSHYLEHLMFWHADNVDDQALHARGGNASVNGIITNYFNVGEISELDDMFKFVQRLFVPFILDKGFVLRERSVVAREYDLRVSENPDVRVYFAIRRDLYNNLPVSRSVIGTPETIHSLTIKQALDFQDKHYRYDNAVLFIAGDFEREEAETLVNRQFGSVESTGTIAEDSMLKWRDARIDATSDTTQVFTDPQVNYERLLYLTLSEWPSSASPMDNWYTLLLLEAVLDSALEGGIARPLRMDNFFVKSFAITLDSYLSDYFELELFAEPDKGVTLDEASDAITKTFSALATTGVPESTLDRVRTRMLQTENRQIDNVESTTSRLRAQLSAGLIPATSEQHLKNIQQVSLDDVNSLLSALAEPERRSIAFIKPEGE